MSPEVSIVNHGVFAAAPVQHTKRLLQSLRVNLHLHNLTWDVKMAYTWAPLPPGDRVAVRYPDGFEIQNLAPSAECRQGLLVLPLASSRCG